MCFAHPNQFVYVYFTRKLKHKIIYMATNNFKPPISIGRQLNFTTGRMNALCHQVLQPYGLSLPQWVVLSCIWREGALTIGELANLIGTGLPATSRIVDRMAERGFVVRHSDEADNRITIVDVTSRGRELDHLANFHETINSLLLDGFTKKERKLVFALLQRMEQSAEKALD